MTDTPQIVDRPAQPYMAIHARVTMTDFAQALPPLAPQIWAWLAAHGHEPSGPPFWKYDVIDMDAGLVVEVGVPVAARLEGDDRIRPGVLPAGRYLSIGHSGHPSELERVTRELLEWAVEHDLRFDTRTGSDGEHWTARLEEYLTDPVREPDLTKWRTRLAFLLL